MTGYDINGAVVAALAAGRTLLREPGLDEALARAVASGRLTASATPVAADAHIIAAPTPVRGLAHKRADLGAVVSAAEAVAPAGRATSWCSNRPRHPARPRACCARRWSVLRPTRRVRSPARSLPRARAARPYPARVGV
ncbi:MAG: hypothetical protein U0531_09930 [Dehalococcoidia bacterium]